MRGLKIVAIGAAALALGATAATWRVVARRPADIEAAAVPRAYRASGSSSIAVRDIEPLRDDASAEAVLLFTDSLGRPLVDQPVALVRDGEVVLKTRTDAAGTVRTAPSGETLTVYARGPSHRPFSTQVTLTPGEHHVQQPDGATVSGCVLVDGEVPRIPVQVTLQSSRPWPERRDLSPAVADALYGGFPEAATLHTDASGRFAFGGLPPGFQGSVSVDGWRYEPADPACSPYTGWSLVAPRTDLVLRVRRLPWIHGRLVGASGAPLKDVRMDVELEPANGNYLHQRFWSEADGTFIIPVDRPAPLVAHIVILGGQEHGSKSIERTLARDGDVDLGDVRLEPSPPLRFRALDAEDGSPIAGAQGASPASAGKERGKPTGPDGRGAFSPREEDEAVWILAPGYDIGVAPVTGTDEEVVVRLTPATHLTVDVRDARGHPLSGAIVELRADARLTTDPSDEPLPPVDPERESEPQSWTDAGDGVSALTFIAGTTGRMGISRLRTEVPISVTVRESGGTRIHSEQLRLSMGESRVVEARSVRTVRPLRGTVVDERGAPVAKARVHCSDGYLKARPDVYTHASGAFRIDGLTCTSVILVVEHEHHAPLERRVSLPPEGCEERLVLQRGHDVVLRVVDPSGAELESVPVTAQCEGLSQDIRSDFPFGPHVFRMLPSGMVRFSARLGALEYTLEHDARVPEATLHVPAFGEVVVRFPLPEGSVHDMHIRIEPRTAGAEAYDEYLPWPSYEDLPIGRSVRFVLPDNYDVFLERTNPDLSTETRATWRDVTIAAAQATLLDESTVTRDE